ncbi:MULTISPECIES: ABC transporter ATP-binding protein [unclassified Streptomyces]|uniref:ABC transporter ATP-binding protein n=1 Tax=unclassified Streptomyces TaxID=2593676 RepID=UPI00081B0F69|nr:MULTISPECIES: dipeptide ABC transporter ATP-binding protein [unclassified Streptomyces]MYQ51385.1 dipeptide ABC transporter ATP-binding protein [Streptomyces sp. SID4941]SCD59839.1 peptide/nickel transport system ATP-binding protein [Streptomyces sp. PalvLS-984]SDD42013.1 peptide/nickel transport system ATP-binding protein [Streptomyces sp. AmelKG-A3]
MTDLKNKAAAASAEQADGSEPLLKVSGLVKHFPITKGVLKRKVGAVQAVDGLSFDVRPGETLGVVGESGCGKSTMGRLVTRLLEPTGGTIEFQGKDITHMSAGRLRPMRRDIQMIFQDPYGSLNPRHTVGGIVGTPFRLQGVTPEGGVKAEVQRLLELVGLNPEHYNRYPHEFSGGQRQRIGIARALALKPKLVVADEPVSALDVSIQAQVVNLLDDLQDELGLTYLIIAHDLSVIRHVSDRIAVMYLGKIVELADRGSLYEAPMHPYTKALMSAVPVPDPRRRGAKSERILLKGDVPSPISPPTGCRFHTRCWKATQICKTTEPPLIQLKTGHQVACHHPENGEDQAPGDAPLEADVITVAPAKAPEAPAPEAPAAPEAEVVEAAEAPEAVEAAEPEAGKAAEAAEAAEAPELEAKASPKAAEPVTGESPKAAEPVTGESPKAAEPATGDAEGTTKE